MVEINGGDQQTIAVYKLKMIGFQPTKADEHPLFHKSKKTRNK